jgi:hypothetical protein
VSFARPINAHKHLHITLYWCKCRYQFWQIILGQNGEWAEAATYYTMLTKASPHVPTGTYARLVQHIIPYTIHDNHI